ncbi:MAG: trigger factor [Spirochaetales bacterium]|nr:trigger factor [Spirochaetales bacterium]
MFANQSIKELENSQVALTLTVDAASIEEAYKKQLDKYAKEATLNGFRKGKAPIALIEKKIGASLRQDVTFQCMEDDLKACIDTLSDEQKPLPFYTPVLQDEESLIPFKANSDVTFTVNYEVKPQFEVGTYKGLTVEVPVVEVEKADVDKEIDALRDQNAMVIAKTTPAAKGDIVTINYVELDSEGNEVAGTSRADFTFTIGSSYNYYQIDEEVVGMSTDEEKTIAKTYGADFENSDLAGKTISLLVKMTNVKERQLPTLDDEFAQDVKDEYKTVKDLVDAKTSELKTNLEARMKDYKLSKLIGEVSKATTITIPSSMIDFQVENQWKDLLKNNPNLTEEQLLKYFELSGQSKESVLASWREPATENLKVQLIMEKIQKAEDFKPNEEEFNKQVAEMTSKITDAKQIEMYTEMIKDDLTYSMVPDFLLANNTFKDGKKLSYADFLAGKADEVAEENK